MKIYILTDIEGAAGVHLWSQTLDECEAKTRAMRLLTGEVNAAIDGILEVVPDAEIIVWDGHGHGGIIYEELHEAAQLIPRGVYNFETRNYFVDETYDAMFVVGQHAMAGTLDAPLCHTYAANSIEYHKLNGQLIGEFGGRAALASAMGVPTVFIAGDDKACAEARALIPEIVTAQTKKGLGIELALHLSPQRARSVIRQAATEATRRVGEITPLKLEPPFELEVCLYNGTDVPLYLEQGFTQIDERTVVLWREEMRDIPA